MAGGWLPAAEARFVRLKCTATSKAMGSREGRAARRPACDGFGSPGQRGEALGNRAPGEIQVIAGVFGLGWLARRTAVARHVRVRAGKQGGPRWASSLAPRPRSKVGARVALSLTGACSGRATRLAVRPAS